MPRHGLDPRTTGSVTEVRAYVLQVCLELPWVGWVLASAFALPNLRVATQGPVTLLTTQHREAFPRPRFLGLCPWAQLAMSLRHFLNFKQ